MTFPPQETAADVRVAELAVVRSLTGAAASDVVIEDEGWDNRVYVVHDGEAVFKFPRSPAIQRGYANEIAMLQLVERQDLDVHTPKVTWIGPDLVYFGYEGMRGHAPKLDELSPDAQRDLGEAIGTFAKRLHSLELPDVRVMTVDDEIADFQIKYDAASSIVADRFTNAERRRLDEFYAVGMPREMRRLGGEPVLCHGDLGPWNVILADDGAVGVIDFGDVCRCDRSKDLLGLYEPGTEGLALDAALTAYGDDEILRAKISVRARALPAMDLLFFTAKLDEPRLAICLDRIRTFLAPRTR